MCRVRNCHQVCSLFGTGSALQYDNVQVHIRNNASVCTSMNQHEFMYYVHVQS